MASVMLNTGGSSVGGSNNTIRERGTTGHTKLRVLPDMDRRVIAAAPPVVVFGSVVVLGQLDSASLRVAVEPSDPIKAPTQGLLIAVITGVTLVIAINRPTLLRGLGSLGNQRDRMEGSIRFREDVADLPDTPVVPSELSAFLYTLVEDIASRVQAVEDTPSVGGDGDAGESDDAAANSADSNPTTCVHEFARKIELNAEAVIGWLGSRQSRIFAVLPATPDLNYSWKIYQAARLHRVYDAGLSAEMRTTLPEFRDAFELPGPTRKHVRMLYFRWELVNFSWMMFYAAVLALVASVGVILFLDDPTVITGATLGVSSLLPTVVFAVAISIASFATLTSVVLRILTVAKRTFSVGLLML